MFMLLLVQLGAAGASMPYKPPVTFALMVINSLVFFRI
jgi:hypothetical protein